MSIRSIRLLTLLAAAALMLNAQTVGAEADQAPVETVQAETETASLSTPGGNPEVPEWITKPVFQYSATGRPDPFSSFLRAQAARQQRRTQDSSRALSPLERFEVTQLKLVGIIHNRNNPDSVAAMVELPDGKGFVLRKGERVGMNQGRVVMIGSDHVQVLEETDDLYGDIVTRSVVLKLQTAQGERK